MSRTVLVIEDEADILLSLEITLEIAGYRVLGATSAEEALSIFGRESPEAIMLDLRLPGMGAWEFLRLLERDGHFPGIPVIVASAHDSPDLHEKATEMGCRAYLVKPFSGKQLCDTLEAVIGTA